MSDNKSKIALVTGGAGGIGAAICRTLSESGFSVGIHYRSSELAAKKLQKELVGSFLIKGDLSKSEDIDSICDQIKELGGIDILVNNAGRTVDSLLIRGKLEDFDAVVSANMRSNWYLTKKISRMMMRKKSGRIINISSVIGSTGNIGQSAYGMSKAAINNLTRCAAMELAPYNILVNSIAPGFIETPMTEGLGDDVRSDILAKVPLGRMGTPEDIAKMVRFLAMEGDYCTGSIFHINGGMYGGV